MSVKQPSIALAMIVKGTKDEAKLLDKCLKSISGYVDGIFLNINTPKGKSIAEEVNRVAKKYGAKCIKSTWKGNFVDARTASFSLVPETYDFVMWLDADDTVDHPEEIKKTIAILSPSQQGVYVNYEYDHDEFGNVTVSHYVARIVRNNGSYAWKSSIADDGIAVHETLNEVIPRGKAISKDFAVVHHSNAERRAQSLARNIDLLEKMLAKQEDNGEIDPRTLFYLATHYYDAGILDRAKDLLQEYMQLSGWAEERCEALVYLGRIYHAEGKPDSAHHAYLLALGEFQNSPRPYLELSELDFIQKRYSESSSWIEKLLALPKNETTVVQRPMENSFRAYLLGAQAYVNQGGKKLDDAKKLVEKALDLRPLDEDAKNAQKIIEELIEKREDIRGAMRLVRRFEKTDKKRIIPLLDSLPLDVQDNPLLLTTRHNYAVPKTWPKKSIALYVGQGPLGIWGPWSLASGIGGSEEAVIRLSRELAKLGWEVTVFATPGERAGFDAEGGSIPDYEYSKTGSAVKPAIYWKQYYEFNPKDEYDVLIAWRNPAFFDAEFKARKKYLWLHDVMDKEEFTKERIDNVDKVIFVGQYHADYYKGIIPEDKWFVSGNGIDPSDFEEVDGKFERVPKKLIYMSAYNRGLKILLDNWGKIRKAVPGTTLDIYYGWESYDALNKDNPERMAWKNDLVKQINGSAGVKDYGRVSQDKITEEIAKADIFAYPCIFPEVYAISYVKALAGGAYPVSTDSAELAHYKDYGGVQVHYEPGKAAEMIDEYINTLINVLKNEPLSEAERETMMKKARQDFSWKSTAEGWNNEFTE